MASDFPLLDGSSSVSPRIEQENSNNRTFPHCLNRKSGRCCAASWYRVITLAGVLRDQAFMRPAERLP